MVRELRARPSAASTLDPGLDRQHLLEQYQQVANAIALLEREPSKEFVAKVVRAADRWRSRV